MCVNVLSCLAPFFIAWYELKVVFTFLLYYCCGSPFSSSSVLIFYSSIDCCFKCEITCAPEPRIEEQEDAVKK